MRHFNISQIKALGQAKYIKNVFLPRLQTIDIKGVGFVLVIIVVISMFYNHVVSSQMKEKQATLENEIKAMNIRGNEQESVLDKLAIEVSNNNTDELRASTNKMVRQISLLSRSIENISNDVKTKNPELPAEEISNIINQEMKRMADELNISSQIEEITVNLTPNVLPFELVSVDYWNGTPKVAVRMDGVEALMSENSKRAGWKLKNIDMGSRLVKFEDPYQNITEYRVG